MRQSTPSLDRSSLLEWALDWVKKHAAPGDNLAGFSEAELGHMAADLGVTRADVVALASHASDNSAQMEAMMQAHGLDPATVRDRLPTLFRDISRVCTECRDAKRCRRALNTGTAAEYAHEFCPNAGTFDDIADHEMGQ